MSRDEGFAHADIDTGQLEDGKFRLLWRALNDASTMSIAVVAYHATVLASWAAGDRVSVDEAAPLWLVPGPGIVQALLEVGLLDSERRIPAHAWESWYRPAWDRREAKRAGGRRGGLAAHRIPEPKPEDSLGNARTKPDQSVPSRPSHISGRAVNARDGSLKNDDVTTCPGCGDLLDDKDPNVVVAPGGQLWHRSCPAETSA